MRGSSQTHLSARAAQTISRFHRGEVEAAVVRCFGSGLQAVLVSERTSDAVANCVSLSFRRVIARFSEASATRAGA